MRRVQTLSAALRSACFLPDGRLVGLLEVAGAVGPELHIVDTQGSVEVRRGPPMVVEWHTTILPAGPDAIFVCESADHVGLYDLRAGRFELDAVLEIPDRDVVVSLGERRLLVSSTTALRIIAPGASEVRIATPGRPVLIAPTGAQRTWMALLTRDDLPAHALLLARLADPFAAQTRIDVSPGHVFDLACAGDAAAVLVDTTPG